MPRIVQYSSFGPPSVLDVVEIDDVHPKDGQVRIAVHAVGLNPYDFKVRSGLVPMDDPKFPRRLGLEFAGVVDEFYEGARYADGIPVAKGDEVLGWHGSALRTQLLVTATNLARKPPALDWSVAGGLPVATQTAHASLIAVPVRPGDVVLSNGAAGAVGIIHAQLAIEAGAVVIGTASERNHELLRSVGVIPTTYGAGLADRVRALASSPVTVVQDNFSREGIEAGLELGVDPDRMCATADGPREELGIHGPAPIDKSIETLQHVADEIAAGRMTLPVDRTFTLDEVAAAYELLESRHLSGKVVVLPT